MAHYDRDETLKRIQQAFEVQRRALQALEEAMLQSFEALKVLKAVTATIVFFRSKKSVSS